MSSSIIFCGTPAFAVPSLQLLRADGEFTVTHVITQPDKPVGRSQELTPSPVKVLAQKLQIPILQPVSLNQELQTTNYKLLPRPDFLVVVAYGQILSDAVLAWPTIAPINIHGSLLPRWRGASPIEHAILTGDTETGVTIQVMAKELDAGPVLGATSYPLAPTSTSLSVREELSHVGARLLVEILKEDGIVDPATMTAVEIDRRVRAFTPWPGVQVPLNGHTIKILKASLEASSDAVPLTCKNGSTLYVTELVEAGKKPMKAADWVRGMRT